MSGENAEEYQSVGGLKVATCLKVLIDQAVDGLDIAAQSFWDKFEHHARILSGENKALLAERTRPSRSNQWLAHRQLRTNRESCCLSVPS